MFSKQWQTQINDKHRWKKWTKSNIDNRTRSRTNTQRTMPCRDKCLIIRALQQATGRGPFSCLSGEMEWDSMTLDAMQWSHFEKMIVACPSMKISILLITWLCTCMNFDKMCHNNCDNAIAHHDQHDIIWQCEHTNNTMSLHCHLFAVLCCRIMHPVWQNRLNTMLTQAPHLKKCTKNTALFVFGPWFWKVCTTKSSQSKQWDKMAVSKHWFAHEVGLKAPGQPNICHFGEF